MKILAGFHTCDLERERWRRVVQEVSERPEFAGVRIPHVMRECEEIAILCDDFAARVSEVPFEVGCVRELGHAHDDHVR